MTDEDVIAEAEKLKAWIRRKMTGGCRMLSEGEACQCPLCNVDHLRSALVACRSERDALRAYVQHAPECAISIAEELFATNPICDPLPKQCCTCGLSSVLTEAQTEDKIK